MSAAALAAWTPGAQAVENTVPVVLPWDPPPAPSPSVLAVEAPLPLPRLQLATKIGYAASLSGAVPGPYASVVAAWLAPVLHDRIALEAELGAIRGTRPGHFLLDSPPAGSNAGAFAGTRTQLASYARLVYRERDLFLRGLDLYGGAGGQLHFVRTTANILGTTLTSDQTRLGFHALMGIEFEIPRPGGLFFELRYERVRLDFLGGPLTKAETLLTCLGYRLWF